MDDDKLARHMLATFHFAYKVFTKALDLTPSLEQQAAMWHMVEEVAKIENAPNTPDWQAGQRWVQVDQRIAETLVRAQNDRQN